MEPADMDDKIFIEHLRKQSKLETAKLAKMFNIDVNKRYNPKDLEGILAPYKDDKSSTEWVREARYDRFHDHPYDYL